MKKTIVLIATIVLLVGFVVNLKNGSETPVLNEAQKLNAEALSSQESSSDCHYKNGYTSFSGKKGGAYDCCQVWVSNAPGNEHCK